MTFDDLKEVEEFAGRLGLALLGGMSILIMVLALMVVAYLSGPKHDHLGRPAGGTYVAPGRYGGSTP